MRGQFEREQIYLSENLRRVIDYQTLSRQQLTIAGVVQLHIDPNLFPKPREAAKDNDARLRSPRNIESFIKLNLF